MECPPMLVLLLLLMSTCDCQNHVFYIIPSDSSHCPQEVNASQCYDLTTLVSEGHLSITPNTSLLFLPGEHFLEQDMNVMNTEEFQMIHYYNKQGAKSGSAVKIACTAYGGFSVRIQNVSSVRINSISFQSCGVELTSVDHSEITDCKWNDSRSSAISIQDSNSVISDCQFMNGSCSDCSGGGIFAGNSNVSFTGNNAIINNTVKGNGGGQSLIDSNVLVDGNLTVDSNFASGNLIAYQVIVSVCDGTISNHLAGIGGGIYVENCTFAITSTSNLLVKNNNADVGGGIVIIASHSTFNGPVKIFGNYADIGGGMVVVYGYCSVFNAYVEFSNNNAGYMGGGMIVWVDSHSTFNGNVEFSGNIAGEDGGGMLVEYGCNVTFNEHAKFSGNSAGGDGGGGIVAFGSNTTFNDKVEFSGNIGYSGGGIAVASDSHGTFNKQVEFTGNSAADGGGMEVHSCSHSTFNSRVEFSGNSAIHEGGGMIIWINSHSIFNKQVELSNNSAGGDGGGMAVAYDSHSIFNEQVNFSVNSAGNYGGGVLVAYNSCSLFNEHVKLSGNSAGAFGGGMAVMDDSDSAFNKHVEFSSNSAGDDGGGVAVWDDSEAIFNDHTEISNNDATNGGGMSVSEHSQCIFNSTVLFSGNCAKISGGSLLVDLESNMTFRSVLNIFTSRAGWEGGGALVRDDSLLEMIGETMIKGNRASFYGGAISLDFSELRMKKHSNITNNSARYGGAIQAASSEVHIDLGDHYFENNSAHFGGALSLTGGSKLNFQFFWTLQNGERYYFSISLYLHFISNHAEEYGGAIWVEESPYYSCTSSKMIDYTNKCFIKYEYEHYSSYYFGEVFLHNLRDIVSAVNNTAISGSILYGGNVDNCVSTNENEPFANISNELSHSSLISSDPKQVCLCSTSNEPDCSIQNHLIEAYSGQQFSLTLVGVGQRNGTVQTVILSYTNPLMSSNDGSETQSTTGDCSELFYTITSDEPSAELILYPKSMCREDSLPKLTVSITIKPCPPGFMLHNQTKSCTCDDTLRKLDENIQCDINTQRFFHQHGVWIDQINGTVIYHPHCPFDYCRQELSAFTFNSSDDQCSYNRSGFICGACREGYSLTLGGSQCKECSHVYLVLFILLALAGVVLVLFLLIFKLTVSTGTINGLIFFANIIGTNSSIFLPPDSTVVLRVFIAWLNLDLGIDTCLFDGLDMYINVWLQFAFPFYVFALIGIIIIVSQRSTLVTKLLGSDPVAVLATLILVAYTKLFRAVLIVMSFTYIRGFDGSRIAVWLYDGNVKYMSGKHIALVLFALLITLLLIIPYTVILLLAPYLQRYSKNRFFFWINDYRLKAFLYSYYAPLKGKYRSWIGLLLVLRLCLLIVFVSNSLGDPSINLFAIVVVVIFLLCWRVLSGIFYANWLLDALELLFIMKLGLFSVATLYVRNTSGNQRALADALVGIAFIVFVTITVYHGYRQLADSRWLRFTLKPKWQKYFHSKSEENDEAREPPLSLPQTPTVTTCTVIESPHLQVPTTSIELREPVLEYC